MAVVAKCSECSRPFLKNTAEDKEERCLNCIRKEKTANQRLEAEKSSIKKNTDEDTEKGQDDSKADINVKSNPTVKSISDKSHKKVPPSVQLAHNYWDEA